MLVSGVTRLPLSVRSMVPLVWELRLLLVGVVVQLRLEKPLPLSLLPPQQLLRLLPPLLRMKNNRHRFEHFLFLSDR